MDKGKAVVGSTTVELGTKGRSDEAGASESELHSKYDVFINHRGPDVKLTFVAHLNDALKRAGFRPFLDAKCIMQGRHVFKSIDAALNNASVHVAVFSKRYAESKYCLEELCDMLQSENVILPVFYDVKSEDLWWIENGPFQQGFQKHQNRRNEKVSKWKKALQDVAELRGFRMDEVNGDENQLVRSIVLAVRSVKPIELQVEKGRFGLEESLKDVVQRLDAMKDNVGILGIVGMGGIGKTTLASTIYNHLVSRQQFQHHSFLKDVRSNVPFDVRLQLIHDLIQEDLKSISLQEYQHGFDTFKLQRILLIVDDIDDKGQFENLIPDIQQLSPGSRIVITSRHYDVLNHTMGPSTCKDMCKVQVLNSAQSWLLFNWHAFLSEQPSCGFEDLAKEVADACGGHPLSVEVIGASLYDKKDNNDREIWMEAMKSLKENKSIQDKLRISYDGLPTKSDKAMFRDIACMMIGIREKVAMVVWESCHTCNDYCSTSKVLHLILRTLIDKSLVKVEFGKLQMHDVLCDMGRSIVKNDSQQRRENRLHLWDPTTTVEVLKRNKKISKVKGINFSSKEDNDTLTCVALKLTSMVELHLFVLDGLSLFPNGFSNWSKELKRLGGDVFLKRSCLYN